jgi:hypothetical protein
MKHNDSKILAERYEQILSEMPVAHPGHKAGKPVNKITDFSSEDPDISGRTPDSLKALDSNVYGAKTAGFSNLPPEARKKGILSLLSVAADHLKGELEDNEGYLDGNIQSIADRIVPALHASPWGSKIDKGQLKHVARQLVELLDDLGVVEKSNMPKLGGDSEKAAERAAAKASKTSGDSFAGLF